MSKRRLLSLALILGLGLGGCGGGDKSSPDEKDPGNTGGASGAGGEDGDEGSAPPNGMDVEMIAPMPDQGCPEGWTRYKSGDSDALCWRESSTVEPPTGGSGGAGGEPDPTGDAGGSGGACDPVPAPWIREGEQVNCNEEHDCFLSASEQDPCLWDCGRTQNEPDPHNRGWPASVVAARCTDAL